jgi:hypothetical protein
MFSHAPHSTPTDGSQPAEIARLTLLRLAELDRLREAGMAQAMQLTAAAEGLSPADEYRRMVGPGGTIAQYDKVAKAVRQVVVLEFELRGLFKAPDRDDVFTPRLVKEDLLGDLYDYDDLFDFDKARRGLGDLNDLRVRLDYSNGPLDALIADIRHTLGVEPPEDDPFAPPADRKSGRSLLHDWMRTPPTERPAAKPRKPGMQLRQPVKPAMPALPRKGFRVPPTSAHNPNTPADRKRNRGPPK